MILFFQSPNDLIYAVQAKNPLNTQDIDKLTWLFGGAEALKDGHMKGTFAGPRKEMITPRSTNAVEITLNMGVLGISRIEEFYPISKKDKIDPMLQNIYEGLTQEIFEIDLAPEPVVPVENIREYNQKEGLALSVEEVSYLEKKRRCCFFYQ